MPAGFFCGALDLYLALLFCLEQGFQALVVWVTSQQVDEIVHRELRLVAGVSELALQIRPREKQPQRATDQHSEQRYEP